jgi:hypothetical protein
LINSNSLKIIDDKIEKFQNDRSNADSTKRTVQEKEKEIKKCKYLDRGHCKFKLESKF